MRAPPKEVPAFKYRSIYLDAVVLLLPRTVALSLEFTEIETVVYLPVLEAAFAVTGTAVAIMVSANAQVAIDFLILFVI